MLWLTTSPCSETSDDGTFTIRWHETGFGWMSVEAWCKDRQIGVYAGDFEEKRQKARDACQRMAAGWVS